MGLNTNVFVSAVNFDSRSECIYECHISHSKQTINMIYELPCDDKMVILRLIEKLELEGIAGVDYKFVGEALKISIKTLGMEVYLRECAASLVSYDNYQSLEFFMNILSSKQGLKILCQHE